MKLQPTRVISLVLVLGILAISSCKKNDPAPLGAQVNAKYLTGGVDGKSKSWKLRELTVKSGTSTTTATLSGCFLDNLFTFTSSASQDYAATEGTTKCTSTDPDAIESGTWAFTLDGLQLNVEVDNTQTPNGLFSPEIYFSQDSNGNLTSVFNGGYTPYPAFVKKIDDNNLVLEMTVVNGSTTVTYTLTLTPAV
jgi:hypothetical protein